VSINSRIKLWIDVLTLFHRNRSGVTDQSEHIGLGCRMESDFDASMPGDSSYAE
jgi:hypothetical protein